MHRKLPKASNLANTINVVQGQMLEKKYEFYPYCDNPATLCIVGKCAAVIFPTVDYGPLLQTPWFPVSKKPYLSSNNSERALLKETQSAGAGAH